MDYPARYPLCRPGEASEALTKHYKLLHKDALGEKPREADED